jgi:hypothetical protein
LVRCAFIPTRRRRSALPKLGASAFTAEREIYFAKRMYAPGSTSGRALLVHEVVVQQRRAGAGEELGEAKRGENAVLSVKSKERGTRCRPAGARSRLEPRYGWNDLVLPGEQTKQLRAVAARVQFRSTVHRDGDFGRKLQRGSGLGVLLGKYIGERRRISA